MDGFEVVASDIRSAARTLKTMAGDVKSADPSADVADVADAMPGSKSAAAATTLKSKWESRFKTWHDDGVAQSDSLHTSADEYDASDYASDQRLRVLMHRTGEDIR